jgi:histidine kinase/DNA gyrase B/HSP90-like ATPase
MMSEVAYFSVDTRLARLLGETYRSTEAALKELVDSCWGSDADNVWITLPRNESDDVIIVRDDGSGMTPAMVRSEYLAIARDRRSRKGEKSAK